MWNNEEVYEFLLWLRDYNESIPYSDNILKDQRVQIFGMDIYNFHESMDWVKKYISKYLLHS